MKYMYISKNDPSFGRIYVKVPVKWDPPRLGAFKLNTDGACGGVSGKSVLRGVIRDHEGNWVMCYYSAAPCTTPLHAELLALIKVLQLAVTNNIKLIKIGIDSVELTHMFQTDNGHYHNVLFICRSLMRATQAIPPHHIFREQNMVADALAKLGLTERNYEATHILSTPPPSVDALVQADKLGTSSFHLINLKFINLVRRDVATNSLNSTTQHAQGLTAVEHPFAIT
ncbi:uncharacterized protein LOC107879257 [Capsicum annuum]|uniref:uncharacterized protein LOC107879257 n=1 Tax=Capsicum annuum TaxID=4072 RepID=UPI0007BEEE51|nr:uncharacterized protein LOC107879257 [Capsicum annuum]